MELEVTFGVFRFRGGDGTVVTYKELGLKNYSRCL